MADTTHTARMPQIAEYRIRFREDPDGSVEGCDGGPLPESPEVGNPDRHVILGAVVERKCPCCKAWSDTTENGEPLPSVWNIDLMDDCPDLREIGAWYSGKGAKVAAETAIRLPSYLGEIARELLGEIDGLEVPAARG